MKCDIIKEMLSPYIDQMLDDSLRKDVEEHILTCNLCKNEYDDIKEMTSLLREVEMAPVPESFNHRMKNALRQERAGLSDAKIIAIPAKNKKKLRLLTSIAAIFAVGLISAALYQDIIGGLTNQLDGTAQLSQDQILDSQPESDLSEIKLYESDSDYDNINEEVGNENGLTPLSKENLSDVSKQRINISGANEGYQSDGGDTPAAEGYIGETGIDEGSGEYFENYSTMMASDEFNRALTTSGIERNVAAVQYYKGLIEDRLLGFKYEILESDFVKAGECRFRIYIFSGKEGYNFNEEISAIGKDGEIEFIYKNEFMGL